MKILLFGKGGQIGSELIKKLSTLGEVMSFGRADLNLTDLVTLRNKLRSYAPDLIINAAAYTDVDKAEVDQELAFLVNSEAVRVIAEEASSLNAWLIQFSTDYVFDGKKHGPYVENDIPNPISVYGSSKLAGENAIREVSSKHIILRTSWVFGNRKNFISSLLRKARSEKKVEVISDQVGTPVSSDLVAEMTASVVAQVMRDPIIQKYAGIYHLVPDGYVSRYQYAVFITEWLKANNFSDQLATVMPVPSSQYHSIASRPLNCMLNNKKFSTIFNLTLPSWHDGVERFLSNMKADS